MAYLTLFFFAQTLWRTVTIAIIATIVTIVTVTMETVVTMVTVTRPRLS